MKNNKGLSEIVATLITILLVLVAVGIIWVVVRNVIQGGTEDIASGAKCMDVNVRATKVVCYEDVSNSVCNATISRDAGGDAIGGVKVIFYNDAGEANYIYTIYGNIAPLGTNTTNLINTTGVVNASKVETLAYFLDDSGNEQLCSATNSYEF